MTWALSGSTITQSGTDTNLSGLAAIAGVTASVLPTDRGLTLYNLGGLTLRVNGDLSWNPETEACVTTNSKALTVAGTLRINGAIERNGVKTYSQQYWLKGSAINDSESGGHSSSYAIIHVLGTGTLLWEGGYVAKAGSIVFDSGSTIRITKGGWNSYAHFATYPDQVRQFATNVQVEGFAFLDGGMWTDIAKPGNPFTGITFAHAYGYGASTSSYDGEFHLRRDYSAINEKQQSGFWSDLWFRFINSEKGSDAIVIGTSAPSSSTNVGVWEAVKELKLTLQADTVATAGTKVWVVDTDDGFRQNWTKAFGTINYTDDRTYLKTTTATAGNSSETDVFSVLLASAVRQTGGTAGTNDEGLNKKSYRGKNGDITDVFEVRYCGYGTQLKQTGLVLKGNGVLNATDKLFADMSITEQNTATVAAYTDINTSARLYDRAKLRLVENYAGETETIITRAGSTIDLRALNLVIDATAVAAFAFDGTTVTIKAGTFTGGLITTGTVTLQNGATVDGSVEDANGVRVTVRKSGGGNFNIAARYGSGNTYTDLGYQADVSTITYTVPKGQPVEVVMWALGYVTYSRLISTVNGGVVVDAEMTLNESINTALDVSPYLPNIALSLDTSGASPVFVITFNAPMTISGIELGKAVIHRLVGQEIALKAGFPPGSTATIVIKSDEIANQLPAARLALGAGLSVTDRVYLDFFINTAPALAINPAYVINPPRADGNQVVILRAKPALDASVMALAVRQEIERTGGMLDGKASQASVTALATANQTEHDATQAAIAALPAPLTATQTRAQVDAALTAYDAVIPADLATLATAAQVTALGAPLQASSYTAPPSATSTAQAVRAELATELGRMDAAVSSRLATSAYTTPPSAAEIATQVEIAILNEDDGRQVIEAIADKIKAEEVTAGVIAATVRTEIKPDLQIINAGVKKASLSIPHTGNLP